VASPGHPLAVLQGIVALMRGIEEGSSGEPEDKEGVP
jgi:hypothetical protein